jgi:hypothetical protein
VRKPDKKWHAVTVVLNGSSCAAAALCRNTRFLSKDAPRLPLPACSHRAQCRCVFRTTMIAAPGRADADVGGGLPEENRTSTAARRAGRRANDKR